MTDWAARERAAFVDALRAAGPGAPTLCEGWTTTELAAHCYVREHRPDASLGVLPLGPLSAYTERVIRSVARSHAYDDLLARLAGPATLWRVTGLDAAFNLVEYFVHTEDVRRAESGAVAPRDEPDEVEAAVWKRLSRQARLSFRRAELRIRLLPTVGGAPVEFGPAGAPPLEVRGRPTELLLLAYNRKSVAQVDLDGSAEAVETLQHARLGL